jgi:hypothetical protein
MHVAGIVDSRRQCDQLARGPQLLDDRRRNAEAGREGVDPGRLRPCAAHADEEPLDALTHLRIEERLMIGHPNAMTLSRHLAGSHELIDDGAHSVVAEDQAAGTSMTARPRIVRLRAHARNQRVDADVWGQGLTAVDAPQHRE